MFLNLKLQDVFPSVTSEEWDIMNSDEQYINRNYEKKRIQNWIELLQKKTGEKAQSPREREEPTIDPAEIFEELK